MTKSCNGKMVQLQLISGDMGKPQENFLFTKNVSTHLSLHKISQI